MEEILMSNSRKLPINFGPLRGANGNARITGPCGDTMEFWVFIEDGKVCAASYTTDGCAHSIKCGSIGALIGEGATIETIDKLDQQDILCIAGNIPDESKHCALLSINTLKAAVRNYIESNKKTAVCDSPDSDCQKCDKEECELRKSETGFLEKDEKMALDERLGRIRNKIIVLSGKGGVGKSTVAANIATTLSAMGKKVGILDVDIHGPSIPMMFGVSDSPLHGEGEDIMPVKAGEIKVMSIGFLLRDKNAPVIWRGPMKMNMIKQFLQDVRWGDLDYLIIDCPPGTGDEPLSVCQLIKNPAGAVIVSTPQEVAVNDVRKSITFCDQLNLPVLGVIENMSGFKCPKCGEVSNIFSHGGAERMAQELSTPYLGRIPIESKIVVSGDSGKSFMDLVTPDTAESFREIVKKIIANTN